MGTQDCGITLTCWKCGGKISPNGPVVTRGDDMTVIHCRCRQCAALNYMAVLPSGIALPPDVVLKVRGK